MFLKGFNTRISTERAMSLFGLINEHEKEAGQRPEWTFSYQPEAENELRLC
jgi:hypothetical protein